MKKIIILFIVLVLLILGFSILSSNNSITIKNDMLSTTFLAKNIPVIDIRTQKEWQETGIVANSHLITFYNSDKTYDETKFFSELKKVVSKEDTFAILCRSGNRSNRVSRFLYSKGYIKVINLAGGIKLGIKNNINLVSYK